MFFVEKQEKYDLDTPDLYEMSKPVFWERYEKYSHFLPYSTESGKG